MTKKDDEDLKKLLNVDVDNTYVYGCIKVKGNCHISGSVQIVISMLI